MLTDTIVRGVVEFVAVFAIVFVFVTIYLRWRR